MLVLALLALCLGLVFFRFYFARWSGGRSIVYVCVDNPPNGGPKLPGRVYYGITAW